MLIMHLTTFETEADWHPAHWDKWAGPNLYDYPKDFRKNKCAINEKTTT